MAKSFFFYDLETSGVNPRTSRIMQFGGQRTDLDLNPIDEPVNVLIKLTEDILPDPDAIMITGITPQKTIAEGLTEAEFVKLFDTEINQPDTIFVGFNSIRFDDEFMRFLFWRNFYDPYEWQWKDGRSRWDILDLSRLTRALRPDGIKWPVDSEGKPTNRLEYLSSINKLNHSNAHDALSDVEATIAVARLIKQKQPKLFDYLFKLHTKQAVLKFLAKNDRFLYASGKYSGEFEKTTVAAFIADHPDHKGKLVYDLRYNPKDYIDLPAEKLADLWKWKKDPKEPRLPVKSLQPNRCPALAPMGVLDAVSQKRLGLDLEVLIHNHLQLKNSKIFTENLFKAIEILNKDRQQTSMISNISDVDQKLYDEFVPDSDRSLIKQVRAGSPDELTKFKTKLTDTRLQQLLPLYKARNYPRNMDSDELIAWEQYRAITLFGGGDDSRMARFSKRLNELMGDELRKTSQKDRYLLEELRLYAQSILPET